MLRPRTSLFPWPAMPRNVLFSVGTGLLAALLLVSCDSADQPKTPADTRTRGTLTPVSVNLDVRLSVHDFKGGQAASSKVKDGTLVDGRLEAGFFEEQRADFYNTISSSNIDVNRKASLLSAMGVLFDDIRSDVDASMGLLPRAWSFRVIGGDENIHLVEVYFPVSPEGTFTYQGAFNTVTSEFYVTGVEFPKPAGSAPARAVSFARCSLFATLNTGRGTYGCGVNSTRTIQSAGVFDISVTYRLGLAVAKTP